MAVVADARHRRRRAERRLRHLVAVARRGADGWRRRLGAVDPDRFSFDDLRRLPPLTRHELLAHWDELVTDSALQLSLARQHLERLSSAPDGALPLLAGRYVVVQTSGTTGEPLVVPWSPAGWLRMALTTVRPARHAPRWPGQATGEPGGAVVALFGAGRQQMSGAVAAAWSTTALPIVAVPAPTDPDELLDALVDRPPAELRGYPSALRRLAWAARLRGVRLPVERVGTSGELLTPSTASLLHEVFGVVPIDAWGATEIGWVATGPASIACSSSPTSDRVGPARPGGGHAGAGGRPTPGDELGLSTLVVADDCCIVEPIDAHGQPVEPGQWGEAVAVTCLTNTALPLLRYRIDDRVRTVPGPVPAIQVAGRSPAVLPSLGITVAEVCDTVERLLPGPDYRLRSGPGGLVVEVPRSDLGAGHHQRLAGELAAALASRGARSAGGGRPCVDIVGGPAARLHPSGKADRVDPALWADQRPDGARRPRLWVGRPGPPAGATAAGPAAGDRLLAWLDRPSKTTGVHVGTADGSSTTMTYAELAGAARAVADRLVARGAEPGARLLLAASHGHRFVAAFFGALAAGMVPVPVAPADVFTDRVGYERRVRLLASATAPCCTIADADQAALLGRMAGDVGPVLVADEMLASGTTAAAPAACRPDRLGAADTAAVASGRHPGRRGTEPPQPLALLQCTSGSSGLVKIVPVTMRALQANVEAIADWLGLRAPAAVASWLPLHHDMGLVGCLLAPVVGQLDVHLVSPTTFIARPTAWLRHFSDNGATHSAVPGFALGHLLRRLPGQDGDRIDLSGVRAVVVGAERIDPRALWAAAGTLGRYGLPPGALVPAYGLAEATLAVTGVRPGTPVRVLAHHGADGPVAGARPLGPDSGGLVSCGTPLDGVTVEIVPAGSPFEAGEGVGGGASVGEIVVQGPSVAAGYWGAVNPLSRTCFVDGRLHTGDAGMLVDGELFVVGRLGDTVKVRGRGVFAEDLDLALAAAGIVPGRAAVALGERHGLPIAVVVLEDDDPGAARRAVEAVRRQEPDLVVDVRQAPRGTIPRTTSGKPRRRQLWASAADGSQVPATDSTVGSAGSTGTVEVPTPTLRAAR